jgi:hypothetical protein
LVARVSWSQGFLGPNGFSVQEFLGLFPSGEAPLPVARYADWCRASGNDRNIVTRANRVYRLEKL